MITLKKEDGPYNLGGISKLEVGISWDTSSAGHSGLLGRLSRKIGTDLDLVAIMMNGNEPVRFAGIDQLDPLKDGSIVHSGDNQTGKGEGDDETISFDLGRVSPNVTAIVVAAVAFKHGSSMERAEGVSFKVYDSTGGTKDVVSDYWPSLMSKNNACAIVRLNREGDVWTMSVLNVSGTVKQGDRRDLMRFAVSK